jgi:hypothetical protein
MGARDKLRHMADYVRTRWRSTNPDSYDRYRARRERERKEEEHLREQAERAGEREREGAERGREYEERYAAERAIKEAGTDVSHRDTS